MQAFCVIAFLTRCCIRYFLTCCDCAYLLCCQKVEFYLFLIQSPLQTLFSLFAGMQVKLYFQQWHGISFCLQLSPTQHNLPLVLLSLSLNFLVNIETCISFDANFLLKYSSFLPDNSGCLAVKCLFSFAGAIALLASFSPQTET